MALLTLQETADYLRVAKRTVYNWCSQGKIKFIKLGGLKFDKEYLDKLIQDRQEKNDLHN